MHSLLRDLRFAIRQLRKSPGFALTAILTLALGVGANIVVFGILNGLVLRPLNIPDPHTFYTVSRSHPGWDDQSYPDYIDYRDRNATFQSLIGYQFENAGLAIPTGDSQHSAVTNSFGYFATGNYFDALGLQPELGRFFHASDEHGPNSAPFIVVSHAFWHDRLNADPRAIGSIITLNKHPFTLIGVAREEFHGTELIFWPDFWVPLINEQQIEGYNYLIQRGNHTIYVSGHLKPNVTPAQATADLNSIAAHIAKIYPQDDDNLDARLVKPGLLGSGLGDPTRTFLIALMFMALLVLLAACANLASIFAARAADRGREIAIRMAIGSTRWLTIRQLLVESVTISLLGGALGLLLSSILLRQLSNWHPLPEFPLHVAVHPDATVYAVALLLSLGSGILFGLLPARQTLRIDLVRSMKPGTESAFNARSLTPRDLLLAAQIAICTILVTSSFVALRGMVRSMHAGFGFNPQGATLLHADMSLAGYTDPEALPLQKQLLQQTSSIPGIIAAGTINRVPLSAVSSDSLVFSENTTDFRTSNSALDAQNYTISPGYLQAAGTTLLSGRDFTWHDDENSPKVAIVSASFAHKIFGNASPIGRHFQLNHSDKPASYEIVGVVQDGKYQNLAEDQRHAMYFPLAQDHDSNFTLVVRSNAWRGAVADCLQHLITGIDPGLPFTIQAWPDALDFALFPARAATIALGVMGLLAALLAVTGIFGLSAYTVSKRMKELGIRVALGAAPMQLMRAALTRPIVLLLTGSFTGLAFGILASGILAHIVYQATPNDPVVLISVIATMFLLGLIATWIPARRAQHADPARLLREE